MFRIFIITFLLLHVKLTGYSQKERIVVPTENSQEEKTSYLGLNSLPLIGSTIDLGYDFNISSYLSFDISIGYTINSKLEGLYKIADNINFTKKSGGFLRLGTRFNWRNDLNKFAPFVGINLVSSILVEEGQLETVLPNSGLDENTTYFFGNTNLNMGICGVIGVTSPATKRINIDIGLQIGELIIDNSITYHSYTPGMGTRRPSLLVQGIFKVKYKLH